MSQVFKLRSRRTVAATLAVALASLGTLLYATRLAGQVCLDTHAHQIRELEQERLATLRRIVDLADQRRREGGASMAELALAKRNVAEAELELCADQTERVTILEKIVEDAKLLESQAAHLAQENIASQETALEMKADLLRWQVRLETARAETTGELNGRGQNPPQLGGTSPPSK